MARKNLSDEQVVLAAWPAAVGKRLARRTRAIRFASSALMVEVEDELWQRNLELLRTQIEANLAELLGPLAPHRLEFRIGVPRRPPQAERPAAADEADLIADPTLRHLYLASRRKAGA